MHLGPWIMDMHRGINREFGGRTEHHSLVQVSPQLTKAFLWLVRRHLSMCCLKGMSLGVEVHEFFYVMG